MDGTGAFVVVDIDPAVVEGRSCRGLHGASLDEERGRGDGGGGGKERRRMERVAVRFPPRREERAPAVVTRPVPRARVQLHPKNARVCESA